MRAPTCTFVASLDMERRLVPFRWTANCAVSRYSTSGVDRTPLATLAWKST